MFTTRLLLADVSKMNGKKLGKAAAAAWIILITCGAVQAQDQSSVEQVRYVPCSVA